MTIRERADSLSIASDTQAHFRRWVAEGRPQGASYATSDAGEVRRLIPGAGRQTTARDRRMMLQRLAEENEAARRRSASRR